MRATRKINKVNKMDKFNRIRIRIKDNKSSKKDKLRNKIHRKIITSHNKYHLETIMKINIETKKTNFKDSV